MKSFKGGFVFMLACGVSILILLAGVISCSKDKPKYQSKSWPLDEVRIHTVSTKQRYSSESILQIQGENFSKIKANNIVTVCGITGTVQSVQGEIWLEVSVPNPKHETISGFVCVTVNGKMATYNNTYVLNPLYNKHDIEQLKAFLDITGSSGKSNLTILNDRLHKHESAWKYYNQYDKVENWIECIGASFEHGNYDRRLSLLSIEYSPSTGDDPIAGVLKLVNCSELSYVKIHKEALTSIDLKGAKLQLTIRCNDNDLTSLTVSHPLSFETPVAGNPLNYTGSTINPQKTGTLTTTDGLHYTLATR